MSTKLLSLRTMPFTARGITKAAIDFSCGVAALLSAAVIGASTASGAQLLELAVAVGAIVVIVDGASGSYRNIWRYTGIRETLTLGRSALAVLLTLVAGRIVGVPGLSAQTLILATLLTLFSCTGIRALRRWQIVREKHRARSTQRAGAATEPPHRVLVAGAGEVGLRVSRDLAETAPRNVQLVGFIDDDPAKRNAVLSGAPILGGLDDVLAVAEKYKVSELVVAMPSAKSEVVRKLVRRAEDVGVRVHVVPGLDHFVMGRGLSGPGNATLRELLERSFPPPLAPANEPPNGQTAVSHSPNENGNNGRHTNGAAHQLPLVNTSTNGNGNGNGKAHGSSRVAVAAASDSSVESPAADRQAPCVLVTGGAGYIGSHLVRLLLARGYRVRILDRFDYGRAGINGLYDPRLELLQGDICDSRSLLQGMRGVQGVIALAAIVGDPACNLDPQETINRNYMATKLLVEACNLYDVQRLVFASSCSVYGASDQGMLTERSWLNPVSLYARTRVLSENFILNRANTLEPVVLRLSTVFGLSPRMRFDLVVNTLTVRAVVDHKISVFGGDSWRPNVHCRDAARAFTLALEAPAAQVAGEIFNVGGDNLNHRIKDLAATVAREVGDTDIVTQTDVVDPRDYRVSFAKIRSALGFEPEYTVAAGVREIAAAVRADPALQRHTDSAYSNAQTLKATFAERPGDELLVTL